MTTETADVVIVGAGPTDLAVAAQLRQFGVAARIIDQRLDRVHESRALVMQPRTLELLRNLGIAQALIERGNDAAEVRLHLGKRVVAMGLFDIGLEDTAYPFLLFISQAETEAILNEVLVAHGLHVERGVKLLEFDRRRRGHLHAARMNTRAGTHPVPDRLRRRSQHRPASGGNRLRGRRLPADVRARRPWEVDRARARQRTRLSRGRGDAVLLPARRAGDLANAGHAATARRLTTAGAEANEPSLAELQTICDRFTGGSLRVRDPVWTTYFRLQHRHAARYRAGRVFLAGDAAQRGSRGQNDFKRRCYSPTRFGGQ